MHVKNKRHRQRETEDKLQTSKITKIKEITKETERKQRSSFNK